MSLLHVERLIADQKVGSSNLPRRAIYIKASALNRVEAFMFWYLVRSGKPKSVQ